MERWNFYVSTWTQAMRGRDVLEKAGVRAFVGRNTDMHAGNGCSYMIAVPYDGSRAEGILTHAQIHITRKEKR